MFEARGAAVSSRRDLDHDGDLLRRAVPGAGDRDAMMRVQSVGGVAQLGR